MARGPWAACRPAGLACRMGALRSVGAVWVIGHPELDVLSRAPRTGLHGPQRTAQCSGHLQQQWHVARGAPFWATPAGT